MHTAAEIITYFFIYAVIGWLWETVYCSANAGRFVYRGFLKGPYCPIYGFGVLLVLYLVLPLQDTTLELFVFSSIVVTILEYVTGFLLERIFKVTLWNYDEMPLNIHGRVAIPVSIFWGFCCVIVVKFVHPKVTELVSWLNENFGVWLPAAIVALLAADTIFSVTKMFAFKKMIARLAIDIRKMQNKMEQYHADAEKKKRFENPQPLKIRRFDRQILNSYPKIKIKGIKNLDDLKKYLSNRRHIRP